MFIKIKFLFNFDNCFGGSLKDENLDPKPPTKITIDIDSKFKFFFMKIN